jgi:hypothetical protein
LIRSAHNLVYFTALKANMVVRLCSPQTCAGQLRRPDE